MMAQLQDIANPTTLAAAFADLDPHKAPGPDGHTKTSLAPHFEVWAAEASQRILDGRYAPGAVRRVYKTKPDGKRRPLAMANVADKVVQSAALRVLTPIVEPAFLPWSACRAGLGAPYAADSVFAMMWEDPSDILKLDIADCFGSVGLGLVEHFLGLHGVEEDVRNLVDRLLTPEVVDDNGTSIPRLRVGVGIEQGLPLSPFVANLVLHHVLDQHLELLANSNNIDPCRFLDDLVVAMAFPPDAGALRADIATRLDLFGLKAHPTKTKLLRFGSTVSEAETFDFLGWRFGQRRSSSGDWQPYRTRLDAVIDAHAHPSA